MQRDMSARLISFILNTPPILLIKATLGALLIKFHCYVECGIEWIFVVVDV